MQPFVATFSRSLRIVSTEIVMLRSLEELEFIKGLTHSPPFKPGAGFEIETSPQSNMIEPMGHTEPCQAAGGVGRGVDRKETMIALCSYRAGWRP